MSEEQKPKFSSVEAFFWSITPKWLRAVFVIILVWIFIPLKLREKAFEIIDTRVYAIVNPMKESRDAQILTMQRDQKATRAFVEAMALRDYGAAKFETLKSNIETEVKRDLANQGQ